MHSQTLSSSPGKISILSSSKCLTVNGASSDNGAKVNQYDCVDPTPGNQQWKLTTDNSDGYVGVSCNVTVYSNSNFPLFCPLGWHI